MKDMIFTTSFRSGIKRKFRLIPLFLVFISVTFSCTHPVTPDFSDFTEHTVANCLLTPDSVFSVFLSRSQQADLDEVFQPITDALIKIKTGNTDFALSHSAGGKYSSSFYPVPGITYDLEIVHDENILKASTKVPAPFSVMVTPKHKEYLINITIKDNSSEKNVYWIGIKHYDISREYYYYETYLSSDYLLFDDFNRIRKDDSDPENKLRFSFHFYTRLDDISFNGREASFDLFYHWPEPNDNWQSNETTWLYIINADQHLDKYMKAALVQYELNAAGDNPVFVTPVSMYSNVMNGKGIFGSYTSSFTNLNMLNK